MQLRAVDLHNYNARKELDDGRTVFVENYGEVGRADLQVTVTNADGSIDNPYEYYEREERTRRQIAEDFGADGWEQTEVVIPDYTERS